MTMYKQSLEQFVNDIPSQKQFRLALDGMGGPVWLAGAFAYPLNMTWVATSDSDEAAKTKLLSNRTALCLLAADHLEQTRWFGLLEDIDRSMKLLQVYLELENPPQFPHQNANKHKREEKPHVINKIRKSLPMDIWLHEYAKLLFEARWKSEVEGQPYIPPALPPFPWD